MKVNKSLMRAYRKEPDRVREIFSVAKKQSILTRGDVREQIERLDAKGFLTELYVKTMIPIFGVGILGCAYSIITKDRSGYALGGILGTAIASYLAFSNRKFNGETDKDYRLARKSALENLAETQ